MFCSVALQSAVQYNYKHIEWRRRIQSPSRFCPIGNWELGRQCVPRLFSRPLRGLAWAKSFGFILEPRIENAIFYTVLWNRLAIEREQGSRSSKMLKIYLVSPSPPRQHKTHPAAGSGPGDCHQWSILCWVCNNCCESVWSKQSIRCHLICGPQLIITPATVCDNTGSSCDARVLWHLWDWARVLRVTRHSPPPPSQVRSSSHIPPARPSCSLLGVKTKTHPRSYSNLAWDRVGIDIDPSQTNERPQISECGAAWSWEAHQLRQSRV